MSDEHLKKWNERYRSDEYAYGTEPNVFLKEQLAQLQPGRILFPAEGEGRNAVYAAQCGWQVSAFDISDEGKRKADQLAMSKNVSIDYRVGPLEALDFAPESFDAIALIYAHFPAPIKSGYHRQLVKLLRKGGTVIFEAFSKKHLEYVLKDEKVGGPKDLDTLFSIEEIENDFAGFRILELAEVEIALSEGLFHNGKGSVVRFLGIKD